MRALFQKALNIGLRSDMPATTQAGITHVNFFAAFMNLVGITYIPIFYLMNFKSLALMAVITSLIYPMTFVFNYLGRFEWARVWALWSFNLAMSVFAVVGGPSTYIQLGYVISICLCFLFYNESKRACFHAGLNVAAFVAVICAQAVITPAYPVTGVLNTVCGGVVGATILMIVGGVMAFFVARIERLNRDLQGLVRRREMLISIISHDVRNPAAVALMYLESLLNNSFDQQPDKRRAALEKSLSSVRGISLILSGVQALLAAQTGKQALTLSKTRVKTLIENACSLVAEKARSKEIKIALNGAGAEDSMSVKCDADLIVYSVFVNLLTNAIKFSPRGGEIKIDTFRSAGKVYVTFTDQGIGIPESLKRDLGAMDKVTTRRGTDDEKGTGFGLPIVFEIIKMHGGQLRITSPASSDRERPGTLISVELPLA